MDIIKIIKIFIMISIIIAIIIIIIMMINLRLARLPAVLGARRCSICGPGDNSLIIIQYHHDHQDYDHDYHHDYDHQNDYEDDYDG